MNDRLIEGGADYEKFAVWREYGHGRNTIGLVSRIYRIALFARNELAFGIDGHQPQMVRSERVQDVKNALRGAKGQRFGSAAPSHDGVSGRLAVHQREPSVFGHGEARH